MLLFFCGLMVEGLLGVAAMCCMVVAGEADRRIERCEMMEQSTAVAIPEQRLVYDMDTRKEGVQ